MLLNDFSVIPAEKITAVHEALRKCFPDLAITGVSLLTGGLSGSGVYKITMGGESYTLKLNPPAEAGTVSLNALRLAAAAGVAPKLYHHDAVQGIAISDFIDNKPVRNALNPDQLVVKLAEKIKNTHAIAFPVKGTDLFVSVDALIAQFKSSKLLSGPIVETCFQCYETIKAKYPRIEADKVFSHNDLNPNNILCDGENIWFIDWDVASLNDRYIDLANAANYFVHTEDEEQNFLHVYFGREADAREVSCFYIMRQVCRIIYSMLMFQLALKAKAADFVHNQDMEGMDMRTFGTLMKEGKLSLANYEGQLMYGKVLLNTAVQQMRSPRFSAAINQL